MIEYKDEEITERAMTSEDDFEHKGLYKPSDFRLAGEARRIDAALAANAVFNMQQNEYAEKGIIVDYYTGALIDALNEFPGVGRRFERIVDGVYTDYAHHPEEIAATVEMAREEAELANAKGVVVVYQPHQNTRQHEVRDGYKEAFGGVDKLFWLPTYLTRENPDLEVLEPEDFIADLENNEIAEPAELGDELEERLREYLKEGYLVILMTAGPADGWFRALWKS